MNDLLTLLANYHPIDAPDKKQIDLFYKFVRDNKDAYESWFSPGHLTGSAWVVDPTNREVLLTHHRKLGKWLQLGGHADGEKDLLAVALREAQEESGLRNLTPVSREIFDVDIHLIPARPETPAHLHYDVRFAFRAAPPLTLQVSQESHELAWVDMNKLENFSDEESLLRMRQKWEMINQTKFPAGTGSGPSGPAPDLPKK